MNSIGRENGGYVKKLVSAVKDIPNSNEDQNSDREMSDLDIENDNDGLSDDDVAEAYCDPPPGYVRLRPSKFLNLPATVFFEYPLELGIKRKDVSKLEELGQRKLMYKSYWERICIHNAFKRSGFLKSDNNWTVLWAKHQALAQMKDLNCLQKVNHFPASWCIGRKDRLSRTLNSMKRIHGSIFDFHPESFILPGDRESFQRQLKADSSKKSSADAMGFWIVKPCASSCGRGIKVITNQQAEKINMKKKLVIQRYIMKPYLIDGKKFDLRIYVLVTGVDPLRVYIHDEGLTRISTANYSLKNISNQFAHLTNYSINKKASVFKAAPVDGSSSCNPADDAPPESFSNGVSSETEGFKWSLTAFRKWLSKREGQRVMETTFDRIFDLCLKTMIAAESEITPYLHQTSNFRTNCFELFGCDVILDSNLNPHLLEVNVSPSLMGSSPLDKKIKGTVIADIFHIVGIYPHDSKLLKKYSRPQSAGVTAPLERGSDSGNPFAYSSLSKMMASQDQYRRDPSTVNVDIAALGNNESSWLLLLMVEDEMARAQSTYFHIVHPTPNAASYYTTLYRSCRFSDHLLAKWVQSGGSEGEYRNYIPEKFLARDSKTTSSRTLKSSGEKGERVRSIYGQENNSSPTKALIVDSPDVRKTPRPLSAGRSMSRVMKQQLPTTPITLHTAEVQQQSIGLQLLPPQSQSHQNHVQLSLGREDMMANPTKMPNTTIIPDMVSDKMSSLGFRPIFVDSPRSKKQSYIVFDGNIAQSTAFREKRDSQPTEISTEMILNFVDAQHEHNLHMHTRSPKDQRNDVGMGRRKSSNGMLQSDSRTPRDSQNTNNITQNESTIVEEKFILKGKYTYTTVADSSSPRTGKFNPFAPRSNRSEPSDKNNAETEQIKYELLKMVGNHPKSLNGWATSDLSGNNIPSLEPYPLQRSGALSLVKAGMDDSRKLVMAPEDLYQMNNDGFLDVLRISDTKARIDEHNQIYQHQQQQQPHRSRSNPSRGASHKA